LGALANPRISVNGLSRQNEISTNITINSDNIETNLVELVKVITKPLYECFDLYTPSDSFYRYEVGTLRGWDSYNP